MSQRSRGKKNAGQQNALRRGKRKSPSTKEDADDEKLLQHLQRLWRQSYGDFCEGEVPVSSPFLSDPTLISLVAKSLDELAESMQAAAARSGVSTESLLPQGEACILAAILDFPEEGGLTLDADFALSEAFFSPDGPVFAALPDFLGDAGRTGRRPLPPNRWTECFLPPPSSWAQLSTQVARLVEQVAWKLLETGEVGQGLGAPRELEETLDEEALAELLASDDKENTKNKTTSKKAKNKKGGRSDNQLQEENSRHKQEAEVVPCPNVQQQDEDPGDGEAGSQRRQGAEEEEEEDDDENEGNKKEDRKAIEDVEAKDKSQEPPQANAISSKKHKKKKGNKDKDKDKDKEEPTLHSNEAHDEELDGDDDSSSSKELTAHVLRNNKFSILSENACLDKLAKSAPSRLPAEQHLREKSAAQPAISASTATEVETIDPAVQSSTERLPEHKRKTSQQQQQQQQQQHQHRQQQHHQQQQQQQQQQKQKTQEQDDVCSELEVAYVTARETSDVVKSDESEVQENSPKQDVAPVSRDCMDDAEKAVEMPAGPEGCSSSKTESTAQPVATPATTRTVTEENPEAETCSSLLVAEVESTPQGDQEEQDQEQDQAPVAEALTAQTAMDMVVFVARQAERCRVAHSDLFEEDEEEDDDEVERDLELLPHHLTDGCTAQRRRQRGHLRHYFATALQEEDAEDSEEEEEDPEADPEEDDDGADGFDDEEGNEGPSELRPMGWDFDGGRGTLECFMGYEDYQDLAASAANAASSSSLGPICERHRDLNNCSWSSSGSATEARAINFCDVNTASWSSRGSKALPCWLTRSEDFPPDVNACTWGSEAAGGASGPAGGGGLNLCDVNTGSFESGCSRGGGFRSWLTPNRRNVRSIEDVMEDFALLGMSGQTASAGGASSSMCPTQPGVLSSSMLEAFGGESHPWFQQQLPTHHLHPNPLPHHLHHSLCHHHCQHQHPHFLQHGNCNSGGSSGGSTCSGAASTLLYEYLGGANASASGASAAYGGSSGSGCCGGPSSSGGVSAGMPISISNACCSAASPCTGVDGALGAAAGPGGLGNGVASSIGMDTTCLPCGSDEEGGVRQSSSPSVPSPASALPTTTNVVGIETDPMFAPVPSSYEVPVEVSSGSDFTCSTDRHKPGRYPRPRASASTRGGRRSYSESESHSTARRKQQRGQHLQQQHHHQHLQLQLQQQQQQQQQQQLQPSAPSSSLTSTSDPATVAVELPHVPCDGLSASTSEEPSADHEHIRARRQDNLSWRLWAFSKHRRGTNSKRGIINAADIPGGLSSFSEHQCDSAGPLERLRERHCACPSTRPGTDQDSGSAPSGNRSWVSSARTMPSWQASRGHSTSSGLRTIEETPQASQLPPGLTGTLSTSQQGKADTAGDGNHVFVSVPISRLGAVARALGDRH